jgi:rSAM/selenodomain-associated transferase 2/rSAM/selenodomain-associated transferase 1
VGDAVKVSILIPTLRDAGPLRRLLADPGLADADEIIVAAPADEIEELMPLLPGSIPARLIASAPGRAVQMNAAAAAATGDWLLFLHADSRLPADWIDEVRAADRDASVAGGAFGFALDSSDPRARAIEWGVRHRTRILDLPYGDQGLFVRRTAFDMLRGYASMPIMEDVEFVRRLRRCGRLYHSPRAVVTSARRWQRDGWIRRTLTNWITLGAYLAGVSPTRLARWYSGRATEAVAVLARDPHERGKTRLWNALQQPPDPTLHHALLGDTLAAVERLPAVDRLLVHTGSRAAFASCCGSQWTPLPQRGDGLGMRMASAFDDLFARGHARVVLVGSDLPTLPERPVRQALRLLRWRADVVLGPAEDGGFYLIALAAPQPRLFEETGWGTPHVLERTLERARMLGLKTRLVDPWYDVDDVESLRRAAADGRAVRTAAWCRAHSLIV